MPSWAAIRFKNLAERAENFQKIAVDKRLRPLSRIETENYYHASLAAYVAAWESYLEELVRNFYSVTSKPLQIDFDALHNIARNRATFALEKFNTPNSQNARALLFEYTGYDAYSAWIWPARSMAAIPVRERLNEILKVRHSFAHGYSIPQYSWNTLPSGRCRLTRSSTEMVQSFFTNLVRRTDIGMKKHIEIIYRISLTW